MRIYEGTEIEGKLLSIGETKKKLKKVTEGNVLITIKEYKDGDVQCYMEGKGYKHFEEIRDLYLKNKLIFFKIRYAKSTYTMEGVISDCRMIGYSSDSRLECSFRIDWKTMEDIRG